MLRRAFLLTGIGIAMIGAGSAIGLARANVMVAGFDVWIPGLAKSENDSNKNQVSAPGGLGNTLLDFENTYQSPNGLKGTMVAFQNGKIAATFSADRATQVLVTFDEPMRDLEAARLEVKPLAPQDSVFVGTLEVGPNRVADIFRSDRLATKVASLQPNDPSGQYVVVYQSDNSGGIKEALLSVGSIPRRAS